MRAALLALLLTSLLAGPAAAATTLGSIDGAAFTTSGNGYTVAPLGPEFAAPSDGIITSVTLRAANAAAQTFAVKLLRPAAEGAYTVVTSIPVTAPAGAVDRTVTRTGVAVAIRAGDRIGFYGTTSSEITTAAAPGYEVAARSGEAADGATFVPGAPGTDYRPLLAVSVEADADGDGAADETQDGCPASPSTAPPCSFDLVAGLAATTPAVLLGDVTTLTATARAAVGAATAATATFSLPTGLTLIAGAGDAGRCTGDRVIACPLGTIAPGATGSAFAVVRGTAPGDQAVTAGVAATGTERTPGDSTAATTVVVGTRSDPVLPGPVKLCTVPRLTGLTKAKAARKLKAAGCATARYTGKGKVRRQSIPRGTQVAAATRVGVTLKAPKPKRRKRR